MGNFTPSRLGQANQTGSTETNFFKLFSKEVLTTFVTNTIFMPLTMSKSISGGISYRWPVLGRIAAGFHTVGNELLGTSKVSQSEREIGLDTLTVADISIAKIDEVMSAFDAREPYTRVIGQALAYRADQLLARTIVRAAGAVSKLTGNDPLTGAAYPGGLRLTNAAMNTDADVIRSAIMRANQNFDEKDVPMSADERSVVLRPAQYWLMVNDAESLANKDWGGSGSLSQGILGPLGGCRIYKCNNLPSTNLTVDETGVSSMNTYVSDLRYTTGVIFHKEAVATVKGLDLTLESEYSVRNKATLLSGHYAMGHGILRPECAVELATQ